VALKFASQKSAGRIGTTKTQSNGVPENLGRNEVFHDRGDYQGQARADHHHAPGDHSPLKAGYIFADCFPSDSSCSSAADHTYFANDAESFPRRRPVILWRLRDRFRVADYFARVSYDRAPYFFLALGVLGAT
jgi:hypothetical protein